MVSAVFVLFFIVIVILLQSYYGRVSARELRAKVISAPAVAVDQARAAQLLQIGEYRWVDQKAGIVAVPIERAMELTIAARAPKTQSP